MRETSRVFVALSRDIRIRSIGSSREIPLNRSFSDFSSRCPGRILSRDDDYRDNTYPLKTALLNNAPHA